MGIPSKCYLSTFTIYHFSPRLFEGRAKIIAPRFGTLNANMPTCGRAAKHPTNFWYHFLIQSNFATAVFTRKYFSIFSLFIYALFHTTQTPSWLLSEQKIIGQAQLPSLTATFYAFSPVDLPAFPLLLFPPP